MLVYSDTKSNDTGILPFRSAILGLLKCSRGSGVFRTCAFTCLNTGLIMDFNSHPRQSKIPPRPDTFEVSPCESSARDRTFRFINRYSLAARKRAVEFSTDNHINHNVRTANACPMINLIQLILTCLRRAICFTAYRLRVT